jgi:hypothetical protein
MQIFLNPSATRAEDISGSISEDKGGTIQAGTLVRERAEPSQNVVTVQNVLDGFRRGRWPWQFKPDFPVGHPARFDMCIRP